MPDGFEPQIDMDAEWSLVLAQLTDDAALTVTVLNGIDDMTKVAVRLAGMMATACVRGSGGDRQDAARKVAEMIGQPFELTSAQVQWMEERNYAIWGVRDPGGH
jgi:hypothetical protein